MAAAAVVLALILARQAAVGDAAFDLEGALVEVTIVFFFLVVYTGGATVLA